MDALSDVFAAVRLSGGVFLDAEFTAPWCVDSKVGPEEFPDGEVPAHLIAYHYVVAGQMFVQPHGDPAVRVGAGEIVLLPCNDTHRLCSAPGLPPTPIDDRIEAPGVATPALLRLGGGGDATRIVCGYLGCEAPHNPLVATLPSVLRLEVRDSTGGAWIESAFRRAAEEFAAGGVGSAAVLGKLAELLFVEAVRRYLASLQDRMVGRALALLHRRVAHRWTTEELAREVGLSRSAFAERFTTVLGTPPMHYLANWRLQVAGQRLRDSPAATAQIAFEVGYESDAAFSRAFKRSFGMTPAAWRHQHRRG